MAEGPTPGTARRGRRSPELAAELALSPEAETFMDEPGDQSQDEILVLPGDIIAMKVVHEVSIAGKDSWITFGMQTRVMENETENEVFDRVSSVVNTRVLDAAQDAYDRVTAMQQEHDARIAEERATTRQTRLQPRNR